MSRGTFLYELGQVNLAEVPHAYVYEITRPGTDSKWFNAAKEAGGDAGIVIRKLPFLEMISEAEKAAQAVEAALNPRELEERITGAVAKANAILTPECAGQLLGEKLIEILKCDGDEVTAMSTQLHAMGQKMLNKEVEGLWQKIMRWIALWWYQPEKRIEALRKKVGSLQEPITKAQAAAQTIAQALLDQTAKETKVASGTRVSSWEKWAKETDDELAAQLDTSTEEGKENLKVAKTTKQKALTCAYAYDLLAKKYNWGDYFIA